MDIILASQSPRRRELLGQMGLKGFKVISSDADEHVEGNPSPAQLVEELSLRKARAVAEQTDALVLADDSGLEVDALDKEPGIYSARYMGHDTSYHIKNQNIIDRLEGKVGEERSARFVCAIAAAFPDGRVLTTRGTMEGQIGYEEKGENGFGYDPIFYLPEYQCYSAELSLEEKNKLSHRGKALRLMKERLHESFNCQ